MDFTETELVAILAAALRGSKRVLTETELKRALDWAWQARVSAVLLDQVIKGTIGILVPPGGGELACNREAEDGAA